MLISVQIYYLTVDLSHPEFKEQTAKSTHHSRGGYYKQWQGQPATGVDDTSKKRNKDAKRNENRNGGDGEGDADQDDDAGNETVPPTAAEITTEATRTEATTTDARDGILLDPALQQETQAMQQDVARKDTKKPTKGKQIETLLFSQSDLAHRDSMGASKDSTDDIQILELHSDNPIISYRGRLFQADWAEVIGTELLLVEHDDTRPLPALRQLAGNVDLLAASCARLVTKEKIAELKEPETDELAAIKEELNIRIPVGKDRTGERGQQVRFLENLIALKKQRGHQDDVTVHALDAVGKDFKDNKDPDAKPRRKKTAANEAGLDTGDSLRRSQPTASENTAVGASGKGKRKLERLSTPTPTRWDLTGQGSNGENDDGDEIMED